ncbi:hypothetical protein FOXB_05595 [Fusarium oxysporum f. sp. conglutinans Fo5176]|uniref:Uncharacterized protein n=1 Tax=Fusarium oxysporum (strain Fo5176) TaxID=660025 RepID=F9FGR6_FUSOF|nr:hypothetical protein FOXB_05595 [Fusarium oxysporum f. sp. conglutinans Fo5176]
MSREHPPQGLHRTMCPLPTILRLTPTQEDAEQTKMFR